MESDRELLELAAKASGLKHRWHPIWGGMYLQLDDGKWDGASCWNSITDDGDALRLAVCAGIKVMPYPIYSPVKHSVIASKRVPATDPESEVTYIGPECVELYADHNDQCAATRRAIVRAAAEIGKTLG